MVARAWNAHARHPAARVRLNAIAAMTRRAELAWNDLEGKWVSGPFFKSAWTCSMTERAAVCLFDLDQGQGVVGEHRVVQVEQEQLLLLMSTGSCRPFELEGKRHDLVTSRVPS